jgi:hypothetical protein
MITESTLNDSYVQIFEDGERVSDKNWVREHILSG